MNWEKLLNNNRLRQSNRKNPEDARNDFESDFGRIIFSPALRRMHDKTQVFPLTTDDNIHSRLTHSMEVMSVGYSLGVQLCENEEFRTRIGRDKYDLFREIPMIVKNICLIHDIGNPPFGHFGETVIQNYFKDFFSKCSFPDKKQKNSQKLDLNEEQRFEFLNFDGNAQGLRVLTKLQILNDAFGLNLTFATLAAYIKYPNYEKINDKIIEQHKIGIFYSEREYFEKIISECELKVGDRVIRHPLCYLMEAADSICYLTMDMEDGYNMGLYDLNYLYNKLKDIPSIKEKIEKIYQDPENYYKNDITKVVNFRIQIIQQLVVLAVKNFEVNLSLIETGGYNKELIEDDETNKLAEILRSVCKEKIFTYRDINSLEITGHSVIGGLLDYYIKFVFHTDKKYRKRASALISNSILNAAFEENNLIGNDAKIDNLSDYYKLKIIVDFVSGMTDQYALNHYQKISGQKIN
ncbi:dGTP triphosphohydrolase [Pedobacter helvus]|uniref:dGTP triphosphohydrolase n=1 Tax=Pedobacter helvus TaxID=2563444 RepID=A0ABW9JL40_9SPHI|nr:dNTP triphosphohydrolase [Pedobacter ureilyticus]